MEDPREFIECFPRAGQLEPEALEELLAELTVEEFDDQAVLFAAGDPPDAAYLIERGGLLVLQSGVNGDKIALARLQRGGMVGEMGLIDGARRSASAIVEEELTAWRLSRASYLELREAGHPAAAWFLDELGYRLTGRVRATEDRIARLRQEPSLAASLPGEAAPLRRWYHRLLPWR